MKKNVIMLVLILTAFLLAACNIQPNAPVPEAMTPIETQATAWQLLGTSLDVVKSKNAGVPSTIIDKQGNPVVAWSEDSNVYVKRWNGNDWQPVGGSLDIFPDQHATGPDMALDKTGQPIVSWYEWEKNTTLHVHVKRWDGTAWVQLGTKVDAATSVSGYEASIAVDNVGTPIVALTEDTGLTDTIYVKRWNGTTWVQLGSALDVRINANTSQPSLALDGSGNPVVAWEEYDGTSWNIYVKRWNGSSWVQVGGALDVATAKNSFSASLAVDTSGKPVVAWEEGPFEQSKVYVKRWTGTTWSQVGTSALNITTQPAGSPSLTLDSSNQPIVAWHEFSGRPRNVYIRRWNGTSWVNILSNPLDVKVSDNAFSPSLALDAAGNPVVAWSECFLEPSGLCIADIYVRRYVTNGWQPFGNALDIDLSNNANYSSMARKSNDRPVVAWQEFGNVYVKEWSGTSWTRLGGKLNNIGGNTPVVAMRTDDKPVVAWSERIDPSSEVYAIRVKYWNGTGWQNQGSINMVSVHSFVLTIGSGNNPIIAYSTFGNNGEGINLYVKRWNGTAWVGMNGSATVTALDVDIALDAGVPSLAVDSTGKPTVAWAESFGLSSSIYIKRWNGSSWVQLGANLENAAATNPSLDLDSTGKPVVAWEERVFDGATTQTNIAIKRWNGTSWVSYGSGQAVDKFLGSHAFDAVVQLRSDDLPVLAMTQLMLRDGINSNDVYMRRWNASLNQWVDFGVPIDKNIAFNASNPSFVLKSNNNPIVSWDEDDGVSRNVFVSQY